MLDHEDSWPFSVTHCFVSFKKSVKVLKRLPDIQFCFNLKIIPLCHTLSKAFDVSKNTDRTSWRSSKDLYIWCVIDWSWLVQESPSLKPDRFCDIKLFSVKNLNMLSYNNLANILPETGSKEIGDNSLNLAYCFFYRQELRWLFSILRGTSHFLNITGKLCLVVCK